MNRAFTLLGILFFCICLSDTVEAQRDTLGRYSPGFKFKNGLYHGYMDLKENCPSVKIKNLYNQEGNQLSRLDPSEDWYVLEEDSLIEVVQDSIWGYSSEGKVYLRHQKYFDRMVIIGSLSHIIHREEHIDVNNSGFNSFSNTPLRREVQVEFLFDVDTGAKVEFNEKNLREKLNADPRLSASFMAMNRKKRKANLFQFLHSYNSEHPIYFPISGCR